MFRVQSPGGTPLGEFNQTGGERGIAYDTTGRWAVVASGDFQFSFGSIGVWDLTTGTSIVELSTGGLIESVAVSPDGSWVAEGYRFADGAEVDGALVQFVGRDRWVGTGSGDGLRGGQGQLWQFLWVDQACEDNDGIIGASRWAELVGPREPFIPGCPGVDTPPPEPDVSTP